jgi:hypothetical protein
MPPTFPTLLAAGLALTVAASAQTGAVVAAPPPAAVTAGVGFDYIRGDYGLAENTEYLAIALNLGLESGPWLLRASLPYVNLEGPAVVVGGTGAPRPTAASESGPGDIVASATYRFGAVAGGVHLDGTARVKLPTADEDRGLGTGETDVSAQVDLYRSFGGSTPFLTLGYTAFGDNAVYQIEDGPYVSAGSHFRAADHTVFTAAFDWRHRLVAGGDAGADAMLAVTHDVDRRWQVLAYALKGFTDASPDFGGGLQVNCRF